MNKYLRYLGYLITFLFLVFGSIFVYQKYELPKDDVSKESNIEVSTESLEQSE